MDLGTVLVTFAADVQEFNDSLTGVVDQMNQVQTASQNMSSAASSGGGFFSSLQSSASGVTSAMGDVGSAIEKGAGSFTNFLSQAGQSIFFIKEFGSAAISTVSAIFSSNIAVDKMQTTFTSLLGSGNAATAMLKNLEAFASSSPFEFSSISAAGQKLLSMKTSASGVIPELQAVGDAVSGVGKGQAAFDTIIAKMGMMTETGKVSSLSMNAIAKQGIDAWGMLAKAIGVDVPTAMSMVKKGAIDGQTAVNALTKGMEQAFGGQMTAQANTFSGTLVRMKNSAEEAWLAFSGGAFQTAKTALQSLETLISSPKFVEFATVMGTIVGNAISALAKLLSGALGPPLALLITNIGKVVTYFQEWASKSAVAHVAMNLVGLAIVGIVNGLGILLTGLANLVGLFADTGIKGDIARAVLVGLGVVIGAFAIYALVAGLIAAGIAAWGFAAGIIAATWPILLVIAAIALIVLAIQHWSEIAHFLQVVWGAVVVWFQGVLHNVVTWFQTTWASIQSGVSSFFGGIGAAINTGMAAIGVWFQTRLRDIGNFFTIVWVGIQTGVRNFLSFMGAIIQAGMQAVYNFFMAPIYAVIALFNWMYAHNYIFQAMIDGIKNIVSGGVAWLQNAWQVSIDFIVNLWTLLSTKAVDAFNAISTGIQTAVGAVTSWVQSKWSDASNFLGGIWDSISSKAQSTWASVSSNTQSAWASITSTVQTQSSNASSFLQGVWNNVVSFLSGIWNTIVGAVQTAWGRIGAIFSGAWGTYVAGPLSSLGASISGFFSNLAGQALAWGQNLIQGFINGIGNMIGAAGQAAQNVIGAVGQFLTFHSPAAQGEGHYIEQSGENMVKGFITGMNRSMPLIQATMQHLVIMPTSIGPSQAPVSSNTASSQVQHIHIYLGADEVASTLVTTLGDQLTQQVRMRMGVRA